MKKKISAFASIMLSAVFIATVGCASSSSSTPTLYPLEFTSDLEDMVTEMPKTCYSTPAEENGFGGNVYSVTGTVKSVLSEDETISGVGEMFSVENEEGTAWFVVADPEFLASGEDSSILNGLMDETMDYTLPKESELVTVYGIYSGYSDTYDAPLLYFGIDEYLYNLMNSDVPSGEASSSKSFEDCPLVTIDDILSGKYNGQKVCIDCIIDRLDNSLGTSCSFSLWYPSGDTYVYEGSSTNSFYDVVDGSPESVFLNAKNGDCIRYVTTVYEDGSFGTTALEAAEIVGEEDLNQIYESYKSGCAEINYEDVQRNPQNYEDDSLKISGSIFQIIDESAYSASYLISTDSGYIYASWYENEDIRGSRFLEGDNVTVYGQFDALTTYNTLAGSENTVPQISVCIIELQ